MFEITPEKNWKRATTLIFIWLCIISLLLVMGIIDLITTPNLEKNAIINTGTLPEIKGQERQIQQLFQNLIGNSIKYSRPGVAPVVDISAEEISGNAVPLELSEEEASRDYHFIHVRDNGIGFEQKEAERIFNVFTRLHGKSEYSGNGVGLSIARKVMDNHRGYIWAEGQPDEGAVFHLLIPKD